jgi:hypothetical protein
LFPWLPRETYPQSFTATWELLTQCALLWALHCLLPVGHLPLHVTLRSDNAAAEAASWKGLSLAQGLCSVLLACTRWQQAWSLSAYIEHVPGFQNDLADGLSRRASPASLGFAPRDSLSPDWRALAVGPEVRSAPAELDLSRFVKALAR